VVGVTLASSKVVIAEEKISTGSIASFSYLSSDPSVDHGPPHIPLASPFPSIRSVCFLLDAMGWGQFPS
jgi:hypothetical protein